MEDMTITAVIPTYRRPQLVKRAIASVLSQTYAGARVCICDNASGDETGKVVAELMRADARIQYHCHEANIGLFNNFNFGIQAVRTPFFSFLGDDDFLVPDFYERAMECFARFPEAAFVCMPTIVVDDYENVISPPCHVKETRLYQPEDGFEGLVNGTLPNTWTGIVFRKSMIDAIGFVDTTVGLAADGGFVWKAGARFPFVVATGVAAVIMAHKRSSSSTAPPLSGAWPLWWKKMIDSAVNGQGVAPAVRMSAEQLTPPNYRPIAVMQVFLYLSENRLTEADTAARGLSECGFPIASLMMRLLIQLFRRLSWLQKLLVTVRSLRRSVIKKRSNCYNENYSNVLKLCAPSENLSPYLRKLKSGSSLHSRDNEAQARSTR